jgi:hypothetical protein
VAGNEEKHMARKKFSSILILAGVALLMGACGGTTRTLGSYSTLPGMFGVIGIYPQMRQSWVSQDTEVLLKLNEAINPATVVGNVKVTQSAGTTSNDVTGKFSMRLDDSNTMIVLTPTEQLSPNANYRVTLSSGLTSVSGRKVSQMFSLLFSTGAGLNVGFGTNSRPGVNPRVTSVTKEIFQDCLGFTVQFSEDLYYPPRVRITESTLGWSFLSSGASEFPVYWAFENRSDVFFVPVGCDCGLLTLGATYDVSVFDAIDMNEERQDGTWSDTFWIGIMEACTQ